MLTLMATLLTSATPTLAQFIASAPAPTGLSATPSTGQVALSWTGTNANFPAPPDHAPLPGGPSYSTYYYYYIYRSTTSGGEGSTPLYKVPQATAQPNGASTATYTDTSAVNGTTYYYQVTAVTVSVVSGTDPTTTGGPESARSNEASATPTAPAALAAPTDLAVYATGSGKITLYWSGVANATGYNIYRGTAAGGEDYTHPVNGATPVTTKDTGPGVMNMFMYSDTIGLTNGTEYFYTVKAVNGSSQSTPSNEDSDVPDPAAVPWDSANPSSILSAFRNDFASDVANVGTGGYALRVVGPDNVIYDDSYSTAQPADGKVTPGTNQFVRPDGTSLSLPDDLGQFDTPAGTSSSATTPNSVGTSLQAGKGPYRRVRTGPTALYRGESGMVGLATPTIGTTGKAHGDTAMIFFGASGSNVEVDSGLQYSTTYQKWEMFMNINNRYVGPGKGPIPPVHLLNVPANFIRVPSGDVPSVTYWAWSGLANTGKPRTKISLLLVDDSLFNGDVGALGAPSKYLGKVENVRAKRVHAIAQNALGVYPTGSQMDGATWSQGYVILPDSAGTFRGWSSGNGTQTNEDGSYDGGHANVDVFETSPYITEDNINVSINSQ